MIWVVRGDGVGRVSLWMLVLLLLRCVSGRERGRARGEKEEEEEEAIHQQPFHFALRRCQLPECREPRHTHTPLSPPLQQPCVTSAIHRCTYSLLRAKNQSTSPISNQSCRPARLLPLRARCAGRPPPRAAKPRSLVRVFWSTCSRPGAPRTSWVAERAHKAADAEADDAARQPRARL